MSKALLSPSMALLLCLSAIPTAHSDDAEVISTEGVVRPNATVVKSAADNVLTYDSLIRGATATMWRGVPPPADEQAAAERAMRQLLREKTDVATHIVSALRTIREDPTPTSLRPSHYGQVLWRLGPDHLRRLEPAVLGSTHEEVRAAGAYILGRGQSPVAVELLAAMLKRERSPRVLAEALHRESFICCG